MKITINRREISWRFVVVIVIGFSKDRQLPITTTITITMFAN